MKLFKNEVALILAMIMVLTFLPVRAFASETLVLQGTVHENVKIGDTVVVTFSPNDVPVCGGDLKLEFDSTALALVKIKPNEEFAVKKIGFQANPSNGYMSFADEGEWVIGGPWFAAEFTVLDGAVAGAEYEITLSGYVYDWNLNDIPLTINAGRIKLQEAALHTHNYMETVTKPTCTEQGYTTYLCECGDTYTGNEVAALGHTEVVDKAVESTCVNAGLTEGKHCSDCGQVLVVQTEIAALGHVEVIDKAEEATCTTAGLTEGKHCSVCNAVIVAQTEIPAKGHSFGDWYVSKEATAEAEGEERRDCACGHYETKAIPKVEIPTEGQCGGSLSWSFDKASGTLTITGSGAMWNFTASVKMKSADPMVPWAAYQSEIQKIVLSEGVTTIGNNAFAGCGKVTEVVIPKTVTAIGDAAFLDSGVKNINFQGDAPTVSETAFQNVNAAITYPQDNETWTEDKKQSYGGDLNWGIEEDAHAYKLGDVSHDGKINAKDSTLILQKVVGVLKDSAKFCEECADVSGDGKLNAKDSTLILQVVVGLRDSFPAQK